MNDIDYRRLLNCLDISAQHVRAGTVSDEDLDKAAKMIEEFYETCTNPPKKKKA